MITSEIISRDDSTARHNAGELFYSTFSSAIFLVTETERNNFKATIIHGHDANGRGVGYHGVFEGAGALRPFKGSILIRGF